MVVNDSSTGGYIPPVAPPGPVPLEDQALQDFLQAIVVGITGMDGRTVRPRWQLEPPNLPDVGNDWAAVGILSHRPDTYAYVLHDGAGEGIDELQRHEYLDILASFYGPNCESNAAILNDGFQIEQNRTVLRQNGMGLTRVGDQRTVPSLVKDRWLYRVDLPITIKRQIRRQYNILNLLSANGRVFTGFYNPIITVEP
jgi:hypothetical protein